MSEEEVRALMASSKSEQEWNEHCDEVKRRSGCCPAFWYSVIILSGLMAKTRLTHGW